jgi:saccharopine dehydrogenase-like NADP-dependent oxidoreductase
VKLVSGVEGEASAVVSSLAGSRQARICAATVDVGANHAAVESMVRDADLTISLLPAPMHPQVAKLCLLHGKDMVTASYVSDEMQALNEQFKQADLVCLNEVGVDPGMDHMSAQKVIHEVEQKGGKVVSFSSLCGGLPAPEAADNQLRYKFSWSPRGVITAAKNSARFKEGGAVVEVKAEDLLTSAAPVINAPWSQLELEHLPNRDSCAYQDIYGIHDAESVYRGTLRYRGWCGIMNGIGKLGLLDDVENADLGAAQTWAEMMEITLGVADTAAAVHTLQATGIDAEEASRAVRCAEWLGCWSDQPIDTSSGNNVMDVFCSLLTSNSDLWFKDGELDMLAMHHEFGVEWPAGKEGSSTLTSSLLCFGEKDGGDSAMARTVGLTTAIAVSGVRVTVV